MSTLCRNTQPPIVLRPEGRPREIDSIVKEFRGKLRAEAAFDQASLTFTTLRTHWPDAGEEIVLLERGEDGDCLLSIAVRDRYIVNDVMVLQRLIRLRLNGGLESILAAHRVALHLFACPGKHASPT